MDLIERLKALQSSLQKGWFYANNDAALVLEAISALESAQDKVAIEAITLTNYKKSGVFWAEVLVRIDGSDFSVIRGVSDDCIIDHRVYASGIKECLLCAIPSPATQITG